MAILTAAVVLLALVTTLTLLLGFALVRRLRALEARLELGDVHLPTPGTAIEPFRATTVDGHALDERDLAQGRTLVAFLSPGCGPCDQVVERLRSDARPPREQMLAFVMQGAGWRDAPLLAEKLGGVARVAIVPELGPATAAFRVTAFPTLVLVEDGVVAAAGNSLEEVLGPDARAAGAAA